MKIIIEDYNGNDICSFRIPLLTNNLDMNDINTALFEGCSLADIDVDEESNSYVRIQLEK